MNSINATTSTEFNTKRCQAWNFFYTTTSLSFFLAYYLVLKPWTLFQCTLFTLFSGPQKKNGISEGFGKFLLCLPGRIFSEATARLITSLYCQVNKDIHKETEQLVGQLRKGQGGDIVRVNELHALHTSSAAVLSPGKGSFSAFGREEAVVLGSVNPVVESTTHEEEENAEETPHVLAAGKLEQFQPVKRNLQATEEKKGWGKGLEDSSKSIEHDLQNMSGGSPVQSLLSQDTSLGEPISSSEESLSKGIEKTTVANLNRVNPLERKGLVEHASGLPNIVENSIGETEEVLDDDLQRVLHNNSENSSPKSLDCSSNLVTPPPSMDGENLRSGFMEGLDDKNHSSTPPERQSKKQVELTGVGESSLLSGVSSSTSSVESPSSPLRVEEKQLNRESESVVKRSMENLLLSTARSGSAQSLSSIATSISSDDSDEQESHASQENLTNRQNLVGNETIPVGAWCDLTGKAGSNGDAVLKKVHAYRKACAIGMRKVGAREESCSSSCTDEVPTKYSSEMSLHHFFQWVFSAGHVENKKSSSSIYITNADPRTPGTSLQLVLNTVAQQLSSWKGVMELPSLAHDQPLQNTMQSLLGELKDYFFKTQEAESKNFTRWKERRRTLITEIKNGKCEDEDKEKNKALLKQEEARYYRNNTKIKQNFLFHWSASLKIAVCKEESLSSLEGELQSLTEGQQTLSSDKLNLFSLFWMTASWADGSLCTLDKSPSLLEKGGAITHPPEEALKEESGLKEGAIRSPCLSCYKEGTNFLSFFCGGIAPFEKTPYNVSFYSLVNNKSFSEASPYLTRSLYSFTRGYLMPETGTQVAQWRDILDWALCNPDLKKQWFSTDWFSSEGVLVQDPRLLVPSKIGTKSLTISKTNTPKDPCKKLHKLLDRIDQRYIKKILQQVLQEEEKEQKYLALLQSFRKDVEDIGLSVQNHWKASWASLLQSVLLTTSDINGITWATQAHCLAGRALCLFDILKHLNPGALQALNQLKSRTELKVSTEKRKRVGGQKSGSLSRGLSPHGEEAIRLDKMDKAVLSLLFWAFWHTGNLPQDCDPEKIEDERYS